MIVKELMSPEVLTISEDKSMEHFAEGVLQSANMRNSWVAAMSTAAITTIFGIALAFLTVRKRFPGRNIMDFLAMLPVSLPGTFIGLSLIMAFNAGVLELTGTLTIIILGMTLRQLPIGYRQAVAGLKQIEKSLEQASTNLGANSFITFRRIILPMLKNSLSVSFVYSFMKAMNTLSTVIFLVSPEWNLASINILSLSDHADYSCDAHQTIVQAIAASKAAGVGMILTEHWDRDYPTNPDEFLFDLSEYFAKNSKYRSERVLLGIEVGMAVYTAQNYGARKFERIRQGVKVCSKILLGFSVIAAISIYFLGSDIIMLFLGVYDKAVVDAGLLYLHLTVPFYFFLSQIFVFRNATQGLGIAIMPLGSGIIELVFRSGAAIILGNYFGYEGMCYASPASWIGASIFLTIGYFYFIKILEKKNSIDFK